MRSWIAVLTLVLAPSLAGAVSDLEIIRCEDEHAICIQEALDGGSVPTPTPVSTPTPRPTERPHPTGTFIPEPGEANCSDGFLHQKPITGQDLYGVIGLSVMPGEVKHFCADITEPRVEGELDRIFVTFGDATDYECGVITVTLKQTFEPLKVAGPSTGTSGNLRLSRKQFRQSDCPECVAHGRYQIIVEGVYLSDPTDPECLRFSVMWGVG